MSAMGANEQPVVVLVVAGLSGRECYGGLRARAPVALDQAGLEPLLAALAPVLALEVPDLLGGRGGLQLSLTFRRMADFSRAGLIAQVQALTRLEQLRQRLLADATPGPAVDVDALLAPGTAGAREALAGWWGRACMDPLDHPARAEVAEALGALLAAAGPAEAPPGHSSPGSRRLLADALEATIDSQIRAIRAAEPLRRLEATWTGLAHLCRAAEGRAGLQLRVLDASREDLANDFMDAPDPPSADLCWWLEHRWLDTPEEDPASVLVVDHEFSSGRADLSLLRGLAAVSARCLLALVAAFRPGEVGLQHPALPSPVPRAPLLEPNNVGHQQWASFRRDPAARWISLCGPRVPVEPLHAPTPADPSGGAEPVWISGALGVALWALTTDGRGPHYPKNTGAGLASLGLSNVTCATPQGELRLASGAVHLGGTEEVPPGASAALPSSFEVQLAASRVAQHLRIAARTAAGASAAEVETLVRAEARRLPTPDAGGLPCARLSLETLELQPGESPRELRARLTFAPADGPEDGRRHEVECSLGAVLGG